MTTDDLRLSGGLTIGVIITLAIQTTSIVWWASSINSKVESHEIRLVKTENTINNDIYQIKNSVVRIETILSYAEIDKKILSK